MFIAALSTIATLWKEPLTDVHRLMIKKWYIYTMEYNSAIKKNEILPFAITWMELQTIMLNEVSQSEKASIMISLMWNLRNKTNEQREKKERQTKKHTLHYREQTDGYQRRGG